MPTKRTFLAAATVVALLGGGASAHDQKKSDANDTSDQVDIKSVVVSHTADRIKIDIRTWESWSTNALASGKRTIYFTFDTKNGNAPDFNFNILKSDDGLVCLIGKEPNGERVGKGRASRNGGSHVACSFRRGQIDAAGSKTIRWKGSMFNLDTFDRDMVPESGAVAHSL